MRPNYTLRDSEASAPGLTDEMKNDVGSYKIGTGRIDTYARLCLYDEVVQGNAVVPDVCCYRRRKIGTGRVDAVVPA